MQRLLEIGLSGWLIFLLTILFGGSLGVRYFSRRRSRQKNIDAGGDIAGGDILKGTKNVTDRPAETSKIDSTQKNITAEGDVAGGNIDKRT